MRYEDADKASSTPNQRISRKDIVSLLHTVLPKLEESLDTEEKNQHNHDVNVLKYGFGGESTFSRRGLTCNLRLLLQHIHRHFIQITINKC